MTAKVLRSGKCSSPRSERVARGRRETFSVDWRALYLVVLVPLWPDAYEASCLCVVLVLVALRVRHGLGNLGFICLLAR